MRSRRVGPGGLLTICRFESLFLAVCLAFVALPVTALADIHQPSTDGVKRLIKKAERSIKRGKLTEAEDLLRQAVSSDPKDSLAKLKLAFVYVKMRRLIEAFELSHPIAKAEPKNAYAFAVLGATMLSAGRFRDARLFFVNSLKLDRSESLAWAGLGMVDFYENDINESLANLQEAVYRDSLEADYVYALAQVSAPAG